MLRLEGILDVTYAGGALAHENPHYVEAQGVEGRLFVEEVLFGQGADGGLFIRGNGLERVPEAGSSPQLHLDEYERIGSQV